MCLAGRVCHYTVPASIPRRPQSSFFDSEYVTVVERASMANADKSYNHDHGLQELEIASQSAQHYHGHNDVCRL